MPDEPLRPDTPLVFRADRVATGGEVRMGSTCTDAVVTLGLKVWRGADAFELVGVRVGDKMLPWEVVPARVFGSRCGRCERPTEAVFPRIALGPNATIEVFARNVSGRDASFLGTIEALTLHAWQAARPVGARPGEAKIEVVADVYETMSPLCSHHVSRADGCQRCADFMVAKASIEASKT